MKTNIYVDDLFVYNSLFIYIIIDISCWFSGKVIKSRIARFIIVIILGMLTTGVNLIYIGTGGIGILIQLIIPVAMCIFASALINLACRQKREKWVRKSLHSIISLGITLYFVTIILGGVISFIYLNTYIGVYLKHLLDVLDAGTMAGHSVLIVLILAGLFICKVFVRLLLNNQMTSRLKGMNFYDVTITLNDKSVTLRAMYDSGNNLVHPVSKRPVSVVEAACLHELANQKIKGITCIPCNSAGGRTNMYVIETDCIKIHKNHEVITEINALIGIYNGKLSSKDEFNMILNNVYGAKL